MNVNFVTRFYGKAKGGIGRYEERLYPFLQNQVQAQHVPIQPYPVPKSLHRLGSLAGFDLNAVAQNAPFYVPKDLSGIVHFSCQVIGAGVRFVKKGRTVVTVHDLVPYVEYQRTNQRQMPFVDWRLHLYNLNGLRQADLLLADSEHTKQDLIQHLRIEPDRIVTCYLGVETDHYKPQPVPPELYERYGLSQQRQYALYVGSQDLRKNLGVAVGAIKQLQKTMPDVRLIIVGAKRTTQQQPWQQDPELDTFTHFLSMVPEEDLIALYSLADVVLMPSKYEGFGLPALEGMACGKPVIAANATSLPEVVGDSGLLVDPDDVNAWAEAIQQVLTTPSLQQQLGQAGLQRAQAFTWENTARQTVDAYRRIGLEA